MAKLIHSTAVKLPPPARLFRVHRTGATDLVPVLIGIFNSPSGVVTSERMSQIVAERFADKLKRIIEQQSYSWALHSPAYAQYKKRKGLDPRILIATGKYLDAIKPIKNEMGVYEVTVPSTPLGKGKHTLRDLARWLEFGTVTMPARPHWRPAFASFKAEMHQIGTMYNKLLADAIKRKMKHAARV